MEQSILEAGPSANAADSHTAMDATHAIVWFFHTA
jgi:hypothetical protein